MTKKDKVFKYLMKHIKIDLNAIEELKRQPIDEINYMGGVANWYLLCCSNYYSECNDAIKYAGYKYPDNDRTWETVEEVKKSVVKTKLSLIDFYQSILIN